MCARIFLTISAIPFLATACGPDRTSQRSSSDAPHALAVRDLPVPAFGDLDYDQRCAGIRAFTEGFLAANAPVVKLADATCKTLLADEMRGIITYWEKLALRREDGSELKVSLSWNDPESRSVSYSLESDKTETIDAQHVPVALTQMAPALADLGASFEAYLKAKTTKPPTVFGRDYQAEVRRIRSGLESRGLIIDQRIAATAVHLTQDQDTWWRGTLTFAAFPPAYFDATKDDPFGSNFLGCEDVACVDGATIGWTFAADQLAIYHQVKGDGGAVTTNFMTWHLEP